MKELRVRQSWGIHNVRTSELHHVNEFYLTKNYCTTYTNEYIMQSKSQQCTQSIVSHIILYTNIKSKKAN